MNHDDVIKWKHFPRHWPFVLGIHRSPVNSPHKGQWRGALMFSLICGWINGWVNNREAGDLRRHRAHYDVSEMNYHWKCQNVLWVMRSRIPERKMSHIWMFMQLFHYSTTQIYQIWHLRFDDACETVARECACKDVLKKLKVIKQKF